MTDATPDANGEDPDLLLTAPAGAGGNAGKDTLSPAGRRRRFRLWLVAVLLGATPALLTLAGALTSPPHVRSVPIGHLVYLEADEPSDHTALLRGLRVMGPDGTSRQLLHETEPQDQDAGSREWISQPAASPDGHWLAFEKQIITLQEEQQGIDNQLWVLPLSGPPAPPQMLLDLTPRKLKQFIGLTWTADGGGVVFLNDDIKYTVGINEGRTNVFVKSLLASRSTLQSSGSHPSDVSATQSPGLGGRSYVRLTHSTPEVVVYDAHLANSQVYPLSTLYAIAPDGREIATVVPDGSNQPDVTNVLEVWDMQTGRQRQQSLRWGWSVFGGRRITALKWSPDGKYLAYSVSKPPLEDELFYINLATGRCFQLPVRTGRAGWDWAR